MARLDHLDTARLRSGLDDAFAQIAGRFARREVRLRARRCLDGLLSGLERKNGWSLAEHAGEATPHGMQRLFSTAVWDVDGTRDDIRDYVTGHLGHPDGVLIGDDTGFEKKGTRSAGVQRQYTGTAGKITNCQIGVFLGYATPTGRALIDRELYLPRTSWIADPARCEEAKIPAGTVFATKPQHLQTMIERALAAGVPFGWVTADEAYGDNGPLRRFLEDHRLGYVLAVSRSHHLTTGAETLRAETMATRIPTTGWQRLSCGNGAKGERLYDWALVATTDSARHHRLRPPPAHPPLDQQTRRAGLLPDPHHQPRPPPPAGGRRRHPMGHRGMLPDRQERNRPRPLPGPRTPGLVSPHHPGHARPGLPRRHPGGTRTRSRPSRDQDLRQRDPAALRRADPASTGYGPHPPLVMVATTPPNPSPPIPLSATTTQRSISATGVLVAGHESYQTTAGYAASQTPAQRRLILDSIQPVMEAAETVFEIHPEGDCS